MTGDDFGAVKLFKFPCRQPVRPMRRMFGHSADVTNIKFSADNKEVISAGGDDSWYVVKRIGAM